MILGSFEQIENHGSSAPREKELIDWSFHLVLAVSLWNVISEIFGVDHVCNWIRYGGWLLPASICCQTLDKSISKLFQISLREIVFGRKQEDGRKWKEHEGNTKNKKRSNKDSRNETILRRWKEHERTWKNINRKLKELEMIMKKMTRNNETKHEKNIQGQEKNLRETRKHIKTTWKNMKRQWQKHILPDRTILHNCGWFYQPWNMTEY